MEGLIIVFIYTLDAYRQGGARLFSEFHREKMREGVTRCNEGDFNWKPLRAAEADGWKDPGPVETRGCSPSPISLPTSSKARHEFPTGTCTLYSHRLTETRTEYIHRYSHKLRQH